MSSCWLAMIMLSSEIDLRIVFWSAVGSVFGVVLFLRGFKLLLLKRLILNTPESRVRSAAQGLVELEGTAKGPHTIPSGLTGDPCFYYRAMAWQLQQSGRSSQWKKVADETLFVPFFLEDSTGRMLVNALGADLDIDCNFKQRLDETSSSNAMRPAVRAYLMRNNLFGDGNTRIEEYCIKPQTPLFVLGTLGPNLLRGDWKPSAQAAYGISLRSRMNPFGPFGSFTSQLLGVAVGIAAEPSSIQPAAVPLTPTAASASPLDPFPHSAPRSTSSWSSVSIDEAAVGKLGGSLDRHAKPSAAPAVAVADSDPGPVPARAAAAATPAVPAIDPNGFEINPSAAIGQGAPGGPFTISSKSQRGVVLELSWKSSLCIWGGPLLTLVSLYILGTELGWIPL